MSFRDHHREMQELVRELKLLRDHNLAIKPGALQDKLLLFAEASLCVLALERFVRIILGPEAGERDTLHNLLEKATSRKRRLITLPYDDQADGIRKIVSVRNTMLHGNYEQAAKEAGCSSIQEYFKTQFAGEIETLFKILDDIMRQIDPGTGQPVAV